jgi:tetratricopeptide (TPR) repeat protein
MAVAMQMSGTAVAMLFLAAAPIFGQSVQGMVSDTQGRPVAGATVYLQIGATKQTLISSADSRGSYRFRELRAGSYVVRAQANGKGESISRPLVLAGEEAKRLDLTLQYAFFDEPNFIVAGVTDTMSRGGHGSDTVLRSTEALAKATVSLSHPTPTAAAATLAETAEKQGKALEAVHEYQRAAELDPTEQHLFDWGADLLKHRASDAAAAVFSRAKIAYPQSLRMLLGLAAALYARGSYEPAAELFFQACDLDPNDPEPYMFLGKVQSIEITQLAGYKERLRRFAERHPENAWANYYYAVSLWKQRKSPEDVETPKRAGELLQKAVHIDPAFGAAHLQLGIIYSDRGDYPAAIAAYQKALAVSPRLDEAYYRLGQAYARIGEKEKARKELETYEQVSRKSAEEAERERAEIRQFVVELGGKTQ